MRLNEIEIKYWYLPLAVILAGFAWAFWPVIETLAKQWQHNDDFSHGMLVVPISVYLIWEKRSQLANVDIRTD
ncbi:MAG: hypothetical protein CR984_03160, partial [Proteobacteria bacterium]